MTATFILYAVSNANTMCWLYGTHYIKRLETYICDDVNVRKDTKYNMAFALPQIFKNWHSFHNHKHLSYFHLFYDQKKKKPQKNEVMRSKLSTYKAYWPK